MHACICICEQYPVHVHVHVCASALARLHVRYGLLTQLSLRPERAAWHLVCLALFPLLGLINSMDIVHVFVADMTHYSLHAFSYAQLSRVPLLGGYLVRCKRHHMAHHFANPTSNFTISFLDPLGIVK
jgi:hypothetical protein